MSDVNLLFVSPVNPRATLLYGVIRLTGSSLWAGFFLLYQSGNLARFGVGFGGVLILFAAFVLTMMVLTLLSLVIYSTTNGRPDRKRLVPILAGAVFIPLFAYFFMRYAQSGDYFLAFNDVIQSPVLAATPFVGWASAGSVALIEGKLAAGLGWLALLVLSGVAMVFYIMLSHTDYYEDVLVATESTFERKRAVAEGKVQQGGRAFGKVKVSKTGLNGNGIHVFLYKHLRETFRQNRFGFFSFYIVITSAGIFAVSFFLRGKMDIVVVLQMLMWIQVFMIGTGRGLLETYSHFIYLIPGSAYKKLIWSNMELMVRTAFESVLILGIPGLIMGSHPLVVAASMATYVLFSFMLLGVNYLFMRFTGADISQGILLMIYFFAVLVLLAPGLAAALFVGFSIGGLWGKLTALLLLSAWELVMALVCFALSKNVLDDCDMPTVKRM
ncbi:hypothetical protein SDC9_53004 [bioreactor metagenome]|uniref:Uncharacterized protein n=1 Tax=bioreactor metagenome TaxID=1076179 RepID=A0A644WT42_9ZZZZ